MLPLLAPGRPERTFPISPRHATVTLLPSRTTIRSAMVSVVLAAALAALL